MRLLIKPEKFFIILILSNILFGTNEVFSYSKGENEQPMSSYDEILAKQLQMTEQTWELLLKKGYTEDQMVQLDFFYFSPDKKSAEDLHKFIYENTDYDLKVVPPVGLEKSYTVEGSTQPIKITKEILDQWVNWMVTAGCKYNSEFDGWGTLIP